MTSSEYLTCNECSTEADTEEHLKHEVAITIHYHTSSQRDDSETQVLDCLHTGGREHNTRLLYISTVEPTITYMPYAVPSLDSGTINATIGQSAQANRE